MIASRLPIGCPTAMNPTTREMSAPQMTDALADRVLEAVAEVAQVPDVSDLRANLDINLYETHLLDSLRTVELLLLLTDRFSIDISPAELDREQWATPRKLIHYLEQRSSR